MKVQIKNFQSLRDVSLSIEGFTVIVGRNNLGKSAVFRAIKSALTNASGNFFVRTGESHTSIALEYPNLNLVWQKGKNVSKYEINGKVYELLKLGDDVLQIPRGEDGTRAEVEYRLARTRTYLKKYGLLNLQFPAASRLSDN